MLSLEQWSDGGGGPGDADRGHRHRPVVTDLLAMIETFRARTSGEMGERRRARAEWRLRELLGRNFMQHWRHRCWRRVSSSRFWSHCRAGEPITTRPRARSWRGRRADRRSAAPLDHVGIAVADAAAVVRIFGDLLGLSTEASRRWSACTASVCGRGRRHARIGGATSPDAPVGEVPRKRGDGCITSASAWLTSRRRWTR
jgi:hypothetical protein